MKKNFYLIALALLAGCMSATGQGTFLFDQQSSDETRIGEGGADIQQLQPMGQSFTPALTNVGFIRLYLYNGLLGNNSPANVHVTLLAGSITGQPLGTSASVQIPGGSGFAGSVDFLFGSPVPVTPGTTYYFQPIVENNNNVGLVVGAYGYTGGSAYFQGLSDPAGQDLWFREGVIVPEPASLALAAVAVALYLSRRRSALSTRRRSTLIRAEAHFARPGCPRVPGIQFAPPGFTLMTNKEPRTQSTWTRVRRS